MISLTTSASKRHASKTKGSHQSLGWTFLFALSSLLLLAKIPSVQAQAIIDLDLLNIPSSNCLSSRDGTLATGFRVSNDNNADSWYWIGIYRDSRISPFSRGLAVLTGEPELFVRSTWYLCIIGCCLVVSLPVVNCWQRFHLLLSTY